MAYYSGSANSLADLRLALFTACSQHGWTISGDNLIAPGVVMNIRIVTTSTAQEGPGLLLQGATGLSGSALVNPSGSRARFGRPHQTVSPEVWPMIYNIHIFENPMEVYLVANFDVDKHWWLAFGVSNVPGLGGTGLWLSAISRAGQGGGLGRAGGISISPTIGGEAVINGSSSGAPFWNGSQRTGGDIYINNDSIHVGIDNIVWGGNPSGLVPAAGNVSGIAVATTLISASPSAWNAEAILIPIKIFLFRAGNKISLVANFAHARYVRVDNYEPGDIIQLGEDRWRVYPFYRKDSSARDGGSNVDHSGTFGWAIRYEGP